MIESNFTQDISALKNLPKSWRIDDFGVIFADISGGNKKFLKSDFLNEGKIPVVDQGKELIAGYVNEENKIVKGIPPYIIFGDHTRILKYIDFPFVMGADGIKVLKVKETAINNGRYLFHFLKSLNIPDTGYNRHFKYLKSVKIPLPPLPQQQKIANILDTADAIRQKDKALLAKYDELTQALFLDMFGDPVKNPKGWEKVKLGLVTNMKAGKFIAASDIFLENKNDMHSCYGGNGLRGYVKSHTHEGEFVLIGRQGALCGNVKIANGKFHATEHAIVCSPIVKYQTFWFYYLLKMMNLNRFSTGAAQPGLNVGTLIDLEIMMVPYNLQNQFAERVQLIEQQKAIAQKSLEKSEELFNSLLQKAFKGELV